MSRIGYLSYPVMIYLSFLFFLSFFFVRSTHYFDLTFSIVILLHGFFFSCEHQGSRDAMYAVKGWVVHLKKRVNYYKFEPLSLELKSFLLCVSHSFCNAHSDKIFVIVLFHFFCIYLTSLSLSVRCHFCAISCSCSKHQNVVRQR